MGAPLPGAWVRTLWIFSPANSVDLDLLRREFGQQRFLFRRGGRLNAVVDRLPKLARQIAINLAGIMPHPGGNLRRQQGGDDSIFVRRPNAAIQTDKRGSRAFLATKAERAIKQTIHEPLETNGHLIELASEFRRDAINHLAAHHRFSYRRFLAPLWPVLKKVMRLRQKDNG